MGLAEVIHILVDVVSGRLARIAEADIEKLHAAIRQHFGESEPTPQFSAEEQARFEAWQAAQQKPAQPAPSAPVASEPASPAAGWTSQEPQAG